MTPTSRRRPTSTRWIAAALGAALVLTAAACTSSPKTPPEQLAAQAFLDAVATGEATTAAAATTDAAAAAASIQLSLDGLGTGAKAVSRVTGLTARTKQSATAAYSTAWTVPGVAAPWSFTGSLAMTKLAAGWKVTWAPSDVEPQLQAGQHLQVQRTQPPRAALEDSSGTPLFTQTPVVDVGIEPALVKDLPTLAATLARDLQISAADIVSSVKAAQPHDFVPVITLRRPAYLQVKSRIYTLPGTVFRTDTLLLGPTPHFAQPLLGQVGQATKQIVDDSAGRVKAGDTTGLSGAQLAFDPQLSGTAGTKVYSAKDSGGALVSPLAVLAAPVPGTPVRLTLDRSVQNAADAALASVPQAATVVALQPSTGKILAVANSASAPEDLGLLGEFPAGSTFKIITYTAAFTTKPALTATTRADCPSTVTVDGRVFENENKFTEGVIPLSAAFAYSCNTTAIDLGVSLPADALSKAAAAFGIGADWKLGVDSFSGSIPASATGTEKAAESIGQGKVLVSPLFMATVAGAARTGTPVAPSLVVGQQATPGTAFAPAITQKMNTLMRAVVAEPFGTAHQLASLPGDIEGKTGTAEFGTANPPRSHAWMVGTRGDLAFAVFVYGGENGTAVPIAKQFLQAVR